jgi:hypothetical protein
MHRKIKNTTLKYICLKILTHVQMKDDDEDNNNVNNKKKRKRKHNKYVTVKKNVLLVL